MRAKEKRGRQIVVGGSSDSNFTINTYLEKVLFLTFPGSGKLRNYEKDSIMKVASVGSGLDA